MTRSYLTGTAFGHAAKLYKFMVGLPNLNQC